MIAVGKAHVVKSRNLSIGLDQETNRILMYFDSFETRDVQLALDFLETLGAWKRFHYFRVS